jgi:hypothetical protein
VLTTWAKAEAFADEQKVDLEFRPLCAQLVIEMVTKVIHVLHVTRKQLGHTCSIQE